MSEEKLHYHYSPEKNRLLIKERGISFERIVALIEQEGVVLDVLPHANPAKYPHQKVYVLNIEDYIYLVPFIEQDEHNIFLKTVFKSRKMTKQYLKEGKGAVWINKIL